MGRLVAALAEALAQPELDFHAAPPTRADPGASVEASSPPPQLAADEPNPCRLLYGPGPKWRTCGGCSHFYGVHGYERTFYKCDLRKPTRSASSDHRRGWLACVHFKQSAIRAPGKR